MLFKFSFTYLLFFFSSCRCLTLVGTTHAATSAYCLPHLARGTGVPVPPTLLCRGTFTPAPPPRLSSECWRQDFMPSRCILCSPHCSVCCAIICYVYTMWGSSLAFIITLFLLVFVKWRMVQLILSGWWRWVMSVNQYGVNDICFRCSCFLCCPYLIFEFIPNFHMVYFDNCKVFS